MVLQHKVDFEDEDLPDCLKIERLPKEPKKPKKAFEFYSEKMCLEAGTKLKAPDLQFSWEVLKSEEKEVYVDAAITDVLRFKKELEDFKMRITQVITIGQLMNWLKTKEGKAAVTNFLDPRVPRVQGGKPVKKTVRRTISGYNMYQMAIMPTLKHLQKTERMTQCAKMWRELAPNEVLRYRKLADEEWARRLLQEEEDSITT